MGRDAIPPGTLHLLILRTLVFGSAMARVLKPV